MTRKPILHIVTDADSERVFGSREFINRTRNTALQSPRRFEPTKKNEGDICL